MVDPQLLNYIKQQKQLGINDLQLRSSLLANGWPEESIDEAISSLSNGKVAPQIPVVREVRPEVQRPEVQVVDKNKESVLWEITAIVLIILMLTGTGFFVYKLLNKNEKPTEVELNNVVLEEKVNKTPSQSQASSTDLSASTSTASALCTSFSCLMPVTKMCEPKKAEISFENLSMPVSPGINLSGKNSYSLEKSSDPTKCKLKISFIDWKFIATEVYIKDNLAKGVTKEQITLQVEDINNNFSIYKNIPITCDASPAWLTGLLGEIRDGRFNYTSINFAGARNSNTILDIKISSLGESVVCSSQL